MRIPEAQKRIAAVQERVRSMRANAVNNRDMWYADKFLAMEEELLQINGLLSPTPAARKSSLPKRANGSPG